jgi:hypothetical protein
MIGAVLESGERERQGSAFVFRSPWFTYCDPEYRFIVVVDTRRSHDAAMMGVITAYERVRPG